MENDVRLRVAGEDGTIEWSHAQHEQLVLHNASGGKRIYTRAGPDLAPAALRAMRLPPGHPEGFHDAFGSLYSDVLDAIEAHRRSDTNEPIASIARTLELPDATDGAAGVHFVETALRSSRERQWVDMHGQAL